MNAKSKVADLVAAVSLINEARAMVEANIAQEIEHERANQVARDAIHKRPRPQEELLAIWNDQRRQVVSLPGIAAERIARFSGLDSMLYLAKPPLAAQMWPGGHADQQVAPYALEWLLLQTPFLEKFTTELLQYLPQDPPDVLPLAERQGLLAKLDAELADITKRKEALVSELAQLNSATRAAA